MEPGKRFTLRKVLVNGSIAAVAAVCISATAALAYGHHRHHGASAMKLFGPVIQQNQKQQVWGIIKTEKPTLETLHAQLKAARVALDAKLLSAGQQLDVSNEVAQLKQAQAAMTDEQVKIAMGVRGILSPAQIAQAASYKSQLDQLHQQEKALRQQAHGGAAE